MNRTSNWQSSISNSDRSRSIILLFRALTNAGNGSASRDEMAKMATALDAQLFANSTSKEGYIENIKQQVNNISSNMMNGGNANTNTNANANANANANTNNMMAAAHNMDMNQMNGMSTNAVQMNMNQLNGMNQMGQMGQMSNMQNMTNMQGMNGSSNMPNINGMNMGQMGQMNMPNMGQMGQMNMPNMGQMDMPMNNMNQMHIMPNMNQMNQMNSMRNMGQMNNMNQMNQMNQINNMQNMGQMGNINMNGRTQNTGNNANNANVVNNNNANTAVNNTGNSNNISSSGNGNSVGPGTIDTAQLQQIYKEVQKTVLKSRIPQNLLTVTNLPKNVSTWEDYYAFSRNNQVAPNITSVMKDHFRKLCGVMIKKEMPMRQNPNQRPPQNASNLSNNGNGGNTNTGNVGNNNNGNNATNNVNTARQHVTQDEFKRLFSTCYTEVEKLVASGRLPKELTQEQKVEYARKFTADQIQKLQKQRMETVTPSNGFVGAVNQQEVQERLKNLANNNNNNNNNSNNGGNNNNNNNGNNSKVYRSKPNTPMLGNTQIPGYSPSGNVPFSPVNTSQQVQQQPQPVVNQPAQKPQSQQPQPPQKQQQMALNNFRVFMFKTQNELKANMRFQNLTNTLSQQEKLTINETFKKEIPMYLTSMDKYAFQFYLMHQNFDVCRKIAELKVQLNIALEHLRNGRFVMSLTDFAKIKSTVASFVDILKRQIKQRQQNQMLHQNQQNQQKEQKEQQQQVPQQPTPTMPMTALSPVQPFVGTPVGAQPQQPQPLPGQTQQQPQNNMAGMPQQMPGPFGNQMPAGMPPQFYQNPVAGNAPGQRQMAPQNQPAHYQVAQAQAHAAQLQAQAHAAQLQVQAQAQAQIQAQLQAGNRMMSQPMPPQNGPKRKTSIRGTPVNVASPQPNIKSMPKINTPAEMSLTPTQIGGNGNVSVKNGVKSPSMNVNANMNVNQAMAKEEMELKQELRSKEVEKQERLKMLSTNEPEKFFLRSLANVLDMKKEAVDLSIDLYQNKDDDEKVHEIKVKFEEQVGAEIKTPVSGVVISPKQSPNLVKNGTVAGNGGSEDDSAQWSAKISAQTIRSKFKEVPSINDSLLSTMPTPPRDEKSIKRTSGDFDESESKRVKMEPGLEAVAVEAAAADAAGATGADSAALGAKAEPVAAVAAAADDFDFNSIFNFDGEEQEKQDFFGLF